ncbi:MAG: LPS export ABC transporter ATP-binding protein [Bacteroidales bacterium]
MRIYTKKLEKRYRGRTVVGGVSIDVNQGEIVGLLGPNGAGKTTTFYMIVGLIKPNEGQVFLESSHKDDIAERVSQDITEEPMYKRAQKGIGYLPQEASVFRNLSVEDNIMSILEFQTMTQRERCNRMETLLNEFSLQKIRKSKGNQLSGGERRRCEIARALASNPKFILLDEPFAGVDPIAVQDIQGIIKKLKEINIGVLITDHNVYETLRITDRAYLLIDGRVFKSGTPIELASDEAVRKKYLGDNFSLR